MSRHKADESDGGAPASQWARRSATRCRHHVENSSIPSDSDTKSASRTIDDRATGRPQPYNYSSINGVRELEDAMPFCGRCGNPLVEADRFCTSCGAERHVPPTRSLGLAPRGSAAVARAAEHDREGVPAPTDSNADLSVRPVEAWVTSAPPAVDERDPLTLPHSDGTSFHRREVFLLCVVAITALSGYCGYRWVANSQPTAAVRTGKRPPTPPNVGAPVAETTQEVDGARSAVPAAATHTPEPQPTGRATWRIIPEFTRDTKNESSALGDPDGQTATILPGGTLALAYTGGDFFYNGTGPDVRVLGPEGDRTPYTIFARTNPTDTWLRFDANRHGFPKGTAAHDFGHHGLDRASQIMLRNDGPINLYIDAIVPLYREAVAHHDEHPHK